MYAIVRFMRIRICCWMLAHCALERTGTSRCAYTWPQRLFMRSCRNILRRKNLLQQRPLHYADKLADGKEPNWKKSDTMRNIRKYLFLFIIFNSPFVTVEAQSYPTKPI